MNSRQLYYIAGGYVRTGNDYYDAREDVIVETVQWGITPENLQRALSEYPAYELYSTPEEAKAVAFARARRFHAMDEIDLGVFTVAEILVHPNHDIHLSAATRENIIMVRAHCFRLGNNQPLDNTYEADFFAPKSYSKVINERAINNSVVEGVRALFNDYAHPRLFSFHWNRHHKMAASHIVSDMPQDCEGAYAHLLKQLTYLTTAGAKKDGSFMRRLQHALSTLANELAPNTTYKITR